MKSICKVFVSFLLFSCSFEAQQEKSDLQIKGNYMGMVPTKVPILLAPQLLNSSMDEYNGTFNPEGTEYFFTTTAPEKSFICHTEMDTAGNWQDVRIAEFSGVYSEYDPLFSPDGKRLYFSSERPDPISGKSGTSKIWYVEREDDTWGEPVYVDLGEKANYFSSITNDGRIYFNSWDTGDLYRAIPSDSGYIVEPLPGIINTENGEGDPFVSPDEDYLIYRGYNNTLGRGDHYISFNIDGKWTEPQNLGEPYNSERHEMCPFVTKDGEYFIFASSRINEPIDIKGNDPVSKLRDKHQTDDNGQLSVYYVSADFIDDLRILATPEQK